MHRITKRSVVFPFLAAGGVALGLGAAGCSGGSSDGGGVAEAAGARDGGQEAEAKGREIPLDIARIYIEYNSSGNDLGFHVFLDGEDWTALRITSPRDRTIFEVEGKGGYRELGMTELFFEGAEPNLDDFPLEDLLALFPEGEYEFEGVTVDGEPIEGVGILTHAVPGAPDVTATVGAGNSLIIGWNAVTGPADILPDGRIRISGYQVIVGSFQVTLPASARKVTVPPEFVGSLGKGEHDFEVLAIEQGGNQTITEGTFTLR
jgi:hypothetical protein